MLNLNVETMKKYFMSFVCAVLTVAGVFFSSCSDVSKTMEELPLEPLEGKLIMPDKDCLNSYPRFITKNFWLSKVYNKNVNCCICIQKGDSLLKKCDAFFKGRSRDEFDAVSVALTPNRDLGVLNCSSNGNQLLSFSIVAKEDYLKWDFAKCNRFSLTKLPSLRYVSNSFQVLDDSDILIPGAPYAQIGHIFSVIDYKKNAIKVLDFWPKDNFIGDSLSKHSVYTDNSMIFESKNKFLYLCGWERYAFIFSIDKNKVNVESELFSVLPKYKEAPYGNYELLENSGKRLGADANDDAICFLMVEKNLYGKKPKNYMESQYGNEVQVYDWNGNPIRRLLLDKVGSSIKLSVDKKKLYLFTENPQTKNEEIWEYDL